MFHHNIGMLVQLKQEEVERKSRDAWKLTGFKQESFLQKAFKNISSTEKSKESTCQPTPNVCATEC